jgi:hypothetical protein
MQRHAEQIDIRADVPAFGIVEMHVSGDGFGIRGADKSVSKHAARPVEGILAVAPGGPQNINGSAPADSSPAAR